MEGVGSLATEDRPWATRTTGRALIVRRGMAQRLPRDIRFGEPTGMSHTIQFALP
ncbi:hypothetical protein [Streptomyces sp. NPDC057877]|uniref:hypothetical protein n=1 Tax=Streptomyces sp. NPDC057877 TaxID=3346269 RepID=UPI00368F6E9E